MKWDDDMNIKLGIIILMVFLLSAILVLAHGDGEEATINVPLMIVEHGLATVLGIAAVLVGVMAWRKQEHTHKNWAIYFVLAAATIGLNHVLELLIEVFGVIILSDTTMMHIEHVLAYTTLSLMIMGFYQWKK